MYRPNSHLQTPLHDCMSVRTVIGTGLEQVVSRSRSMQLTAMPGAVRRGSLA